MGHAATYVTFDVLGRALRDAGHEVRYVQNVTDVDDPLLARAVRDGVDWIHLADRETSLFREDMTALSVIAPDHYLGVTESIDLIVADVEALLANGMAYRVDTPDAVGADGRDVYLDISQRPGFGDLSGLTREEMLPIFGERGGDPERARAVELAHLVGADDHRVGVPLPKRLGLADGQRPRPLGDGKRAQRLLGGLLVEGRRHARH